MKFGTAALKRKSARLFIGMFSCTFSRFFSQKIRETKDTEKRAVFITTLCEMKNTDGELVLLLV